MNDFNGIYPILYAFFDEQGKLDRDAMRRQAEACVAMGAHGVAALGLATEVSKLSETERHDVMAWLAEDVGGRLPIAITIFGKTPAEQIAYVKAAEELFSRDKVALVSGSLFSHVGLAISAYAKRKKRLYIAAEPLADAVVWSKGHRYTFRLRPSTYMQAAMLAAEAAKNMKAKRWATIAPNYAYGKDAVAAFRKVLKKLRPDADRGLLPVVKGVRSGRKLAEAPPEEQRSGQSAPPEDPDSSAVHEGIRTSSFSMGSGKRMTYRTGRINE